MAHTKVALAVFLHVCTHLDTSMLVDVSSAL
jgi:hypothetical protein